MFVGINTHGDKCSALNLVPDGYASHLGDCEVLWEPHLNGGYPGRINPSALWCRMRLSNFFYSKAIPMR